MHWLTWLELPLARIGRLKQLPVVVALVALVAVAEAFADDVGKVMVAGCLGLVGYVLIHGSGELFEAQGSTG